MTVFKTMKVNEDWGLLSFKKLIKVHTLVYTCAVYLKTSEIMRALCDKNSSFV